jgi:hypothetical protein
MDIMEYLLFEMATIMCSKRDINVAHTIAEIDEINASIDESEECLLAWCSLENFMDAKGYYEERILQGEALGLFGVETKDLLDYSERLISMKREREK